MKVTPIETLQEEPEEIIENTETAQVEETEEDDGKEIFSNPDLTNISKNSKEINKLWNSFSKISNRVNSISSTDKLENKFEHRFTALEESSEVNSSQITQLENDIYGKLDNIWIFLEEKGTSKMKKAIGNIQD
jgi:hypothetical protein